jgi:CAAX prenyl protease-like protein
MTHQTASDDPQTLEHPTVLEYCAPAVVFAVMTAVEGYLPVAYYPIAYAAKVCAVTLTLVWCRRILRDIVPSWSVVAPSVVVGVVVLVIWILGERWLAYPHLGDRVAYNPFAQLSPLAASAFLVVRLYGLIIMVPVFEELLWRSFLSRYATSANFASVPIGSFSTTAFWIVSGAGALSHTEWLVALAANMLYLLLLKQTHSVFATVVAHATTNALLGIYVITTANWQLW